MEPFIPDDVTDRRIICAVDLVTFRLLVIISEDGEVRGLKHLKQIHDPVLFRHFLEDPEAFADFLQRHWHEACSNLFAFQIQPIHHALSRLIIHVSAASNDKGTPGTVHTLLQLKRILQTEFDFVVGGITFNGDS